MASVSRHPRRRDQLETFVGSDQGPGCAAVNQQGSGWSRTKRFVRTRAVGRQRLSAVKRSRAVCTKDGRLRGHFGRSRGKCAAATGSVIRNSMTSTASWRNRKEDRRRSQGLANHAVIALARGLAIGSRIGSAITISPVRRLSVL